MYSDAHIHLSDEIITCLKEKPIKAIVSCTTPKQCVEAEALCLQYPELKMSCGVHPWNASTIKLEEMQTWMDTCDLIGEIGMDDVWCDVSLELQEAVFIKQVEYAYKQQKPVILHTKGQEKEIANIIKKYPNTYLVHWYSCMEHVDAYKEMGCYFSVGPDLEDPAVKQVVNEIKLDYLLIETDGIAAIAWAKNCELKDVDYFKTLDEIAAYIAKVKHVSHQEVRDIVNHNVDHFINRK